ncbi:MAG: apolipoprotein N-acyltransferase [Actinomycetales bacterium]|nr:MAG: apolipoprotein N-acyltransferase [Actinomycetales bacterium]
MVIIFIAASFASAAFEPIGIWYLAILGFALFFRKLRNSAKPIVHSLIFGLILNAIVLHWTGKYVGALPWLLLASLQALFYIPIGWIYKRSHSIWWSALTLLIMEELRARVPFGGFGWTRIAFSQVDSPALPIVSLGGVLALSAFTVLVATLLIKFTAKSMLIVAMVFIATNFIPSNPQGSGSVRLLAVQGNTPSVGLHFNSRAKAVFNLHRDTTREFAQATYDAIVWPENAIDIDPRQFPEVAADITSLTTELQTPLIAGVVQRREGSPENASIMYSKNGDRQSVYIKRGLTPFGEYMPLRKLAELVSPLARNVNDFVSGDKRVVHKIAGAKVAPIICYEIIRDDLVRDMALNSQALIVQTNSATFANTAQSAQQLAITRIRAVEHSRYILSVSTIGISAFIDNNGRVISHTPEDIKSFLVGDLELNSNQTFIDRLLG